MKEQKAKTANYDTSWKLILDKFLPGFMKLFFPDVYDEIDWEMGYVSLEKELSQISSGAVVGKKVVDKLLKVFQNHGKEVWVYIHLEVQSQQDLNVAERMYIYNSLLYLQYKKPIMSLLVLGDDRPNWKPDRFEYNIWGSQLYLKFQTVKLLDFRNRIEEIKKSGNPFAFFVIAHLKTLETHKKPKQRLYHKEAIAKEMLLQGFRGEDVYSLLKFIDILMTLPSDLEDIFMENIHKFQERKNMEILAPFEQIIKKRAEKIGEERGERRGERRGEKRGEKRGEQKGSLKEAQATLIDILTVKFGKTPPSLIKSINSLDDLTFLRDLRLHALKEDSLHEIKSFINEFKTRSK